MIAGLGNMASAALIHNAVNIDAIEGDTATPGGWNVEITGTTSNFAADTPSAGLLRMFVDQPTGDTRFHQPAAGLGSEWTMETRFQIVASDSNNSDDAFQAIVRSGSQVDIRIGSDNIFVGTNPGGTPELFSGLNLLDGAFHVLRIGLDSGGTAHIWLDGAEATYTPSASGSDQAIFGDSSSSIDNATVDFDYVRYNTSYVALIPEPSSIALLGIALVGMVGVARRRMS